MANQPIRVIKLGGSLLEWPELPDRFRAWLAEQAPAANVVIVGGGAIVDRLRALDRMHNLSPAAVHWLAIRAMGLTAALFAELLPEARQEMGVFSASALAEARAAEKNSVPFIWDVERFLRDDAGGANPLPCGWDVTSDSIAARAASVLGASELVLLKSALPAATDSLEAWAAEGYVDAYFPRAARGLTVRCVDLRSSEHAQTSER